MGELDCLYSELDSALLMSEEEICELYNVDCKEDAIRGIQEEIEYLENRLDWSCDYSEDEDDEEDRAQLCHSQGLWY